MFLFQLCLLCRDQKAALIYIPLCFYFNKYDTKPPTLYLSHLHSIMFLFQYLISACNAVAQFNLHSIMFLFQSDSSAFCSALALFTFHYVSISIYTGCVIFQKFFAIYIPLCFYFNLSAILSISSPKINLHSIMFLFQSVSTPDYMPPYKFTFHYVSISIIQHTQ